MNDQAPVQDIAGQLAGFASELDFAAIPPATARRATYLILDAVGIAFASTNFEFAHRALTALTELGAGEQPVIGFAAKLPLRDSVLMNALLVHGLDFDDTHVPGVIHLTTSCFPTALGVAAQARRSGKDLLTAYVIGVETAARLAAVAKGAFHQVGFHPTGLVGAFGCALVAAKLLGSSHDQIVTAQGVVLSFASGSLEFLQDGAWTKRLHPGWAGVCGITAATLARHGFVAPAKPYDGRFGLYAGHLGALADACDYTLATRGLGTVWELEQVAIKPLPACHFTHACADAGAALHHAHGLRSDDIVSVRALVPREVMKTVCEPVSRKRAPANGYEAQFSVPYIVATALRFGKFGLADLDDAALRDAETLALASKVNCEADPDSPFPKFYSGEVIVTMADGHEFRHREEANRGSAERPISEADIEAKFLDNMRLVASARRAEEVRDHVLGMTAMPDASVLLATLALPH